MTKYVILQYKTCWKLKKITKNVLQTTFDFSSNVSVILWDPKAECILSFCNGWCYKEKLSEGKGVIVIN